MRYVFLAALLGAAPLTMNTTRAQQPAKLSADAKAVVDGNNVFALDLYHRLAKKDGNLFFSPYSISNALAMTYAGAKNKTAEQMATTLHFGLEQGRLHPAFKDVMAEVNGDGKSRKYQLVTANRLWGQKDYGFLPDFLKTTEANYGAGLKEVDFAGATEAARKEINAWVEQQTKDKIKELLKPGILSGDTRLVLTNAIYFKAAWMRPFSEKATKDGVFTTAAGAKVKVPMMRGNPRTGFFDGDTFQMLELPYENRDLSMLVLLPKTPDGLPALEKSLTAANLDAWTRKLGDYIVDTTLPKFKVTAEFMLAPVLKEMGMADAFDPLKADFSGMTSRDKLFISHVVHKAFVDVNEKGTEAAAATAVVMDRTSAPRPAIFTADRPFAFVIRDNRTGSILFVGRVADPS